MKASHSYEATDFMDDTFVYDCIIIGDNFDYNCADINETNTFLACGLKNSEICVGDLSLYSMGSAISLKYGTMLKTVRLSESNLTIQEFSPGPKLDNILKGHKDEINGIAYAPSGLLMSCSDDCTARAWSMCDFKSVNVYNVDDQPMTYIAASDDCFATASCNRVRLWNYSSKMPLTNLKHSSYVEHMKFDPNGKYLATACDDKTVQLWTIKDGESIWTLPNQDSNVRCIAFSPDGNNMACTDDGGWIKIWDITSQKLYSQTFAHSKPGYGIVYNSSNTLIASCGADSAINLWDAKKSTPDGEIGEHAKRSKVYSHEFEGRYVWFRQFNQRKIISVGGEKKRRS